MKRFTVRIMKSGYSGKISYYVFDTVSKSRVSRHATIDKMSAEISADELNISNMVKDYSEDPRPYEIRRAEAAEQYGKL